MRAVSMLAVALATGLSVAHPMHEDKAAEMKPKEYKEGKEMEDEYDDFTILNYALTLEYLERKFYREGLANFTKADFVEAGFEDPFYDNLLEVAYDEETHVDFLRGAIEAAGGTPVNEAMYAFGGTDVKTFVTLSSILEGVGVSAYLGAAASIMEKDYLTAAGTILTVEARHSSYVRAALGQVPFPAPFDTPLSFNAVFSLAAGFITGFAPGDAALPFKAFPALAPACSAGAYAANSTVVFPGAYETYKLDDGCPLYAAFFSGLTPTIVPIGISGADYSAEIPSSAAGQVYVVLTKSADMANDDTIVAGPAVLEVIASPRTYTGELAGDGEMMESGDEESMMAVAMCP